jgi:succinate-semialdehyde dehydrogenase / glutarate-semialdehyde dehydrogenase
MPVQTVNPATEEVLNTYEIMSQEEVNTIINNSNQAFQSWKNLTLQERSTYFTKLAEVLKANKEVWGRLMTQEMGKPISESTAEVEKCGILAEELTKYAPEWLEEETVNAGGKEHIITFDPLGIVYIVMPWNYPFWQAFKVALPPLMAGNTIILKHARNVTGCSLAIEDAFKQAGFPENIFRSVVVDHAGSEAIVTHDLIAACSLTGSVGAGAKMGEQAGRSIKKVVLELGGSDPFIVLDDADVEVAAQGAVKGRMSNAGQVCISAKRFIVHKNIAEAFSKRFAELTKELKIGDPLNPETKIGPLVNARAVEEMHDFIKDAESKGATLLVGGKPREGKGCFFEPAVLTNATEAMTCVQQETFGPVAPIITVETDEEAIRIANNSEFGLNGSVWSKDIERAKSVARKVNTGAMFINSFSKSHPLLPLGGIKKSGYGRELGKYGIKEFVNIKTINVY